MEHIIKSTKGQDVLKISTSETAVDIIQLQAPPIYGQEQRNITIEVLTTDKSFELSRTDGDKLAQLISNRIV